MSAPSPLPPDIERALFQYYGFSSFRPGQREIVDAVLQGAPVMAIMPTGAGKSLCYQLPALVDAAGCTLVISPLIALMKDQVDGLVARSIPATFINSHLSPQERYERLAGLRAGRYRLVYVAPERFRAGGFLEALQGCNVTRIAVDEAHCISQWGHDFRPDYLRLPEVVAALRGPQVCAFTATATPEVRRDIQRALQLERPRVFVHGFRRPNLTLRVVHTGGPRDKLEKLQAWLTRQDGAGIIYAATRKSVEELARVIATWKIPVAAYHAGLPEDARNDAQDRFMSGRAKVICATNAFGMGVDKPDTRFVVHHDMPGSIEAYYQEIGRAGRDGDPAECVALFSYRDVRIQEFFIEQIGQNTDEQREPMGPDQIAHLQALERAKLKRVVRYSFSEECRHALLLRYFGESSGLADKCGACDNCLGERGLAAPTKAKPKASAPAAPAPASTRPSHPLPAHGATRKVTGAELIAVRKVLSGVARGRGELTYEELACLLRGKGKAMPQGLKDSPTSGALSTMASADVEALAHSLVECGCIKSQGERPPRLSLTQLGIAVMRGEATFDWSRPPLLEEEENLLFDPLLLQRLRAARLEIATAAGAPPFVVAHDSTLLRLAAFRPTNVESLANIK